MQKKFEQIQAKGTLDVTLFFYLSNRVYLCSQGHYKSSVSLRISSINWCTHQRVILLCRILHRKYKKIVTCRIMVLKTRNHSSSKRSRSLRLLNTVKRFRIKVNQVYATHHCKRSQERAVSCPSERLYNSLPLLFTLWPRLSITSSLTAWCRRLKLNSKSWRSETNLIWSSCWCSSRRLQRSRWEKTNSSK